MLNINLLPWREQKQLSEKRKVLQFGISAFCFSFILILSWYYFLKWKIFHLERKITELQIEQKEFAKTPTNKPSEITNETNNAFLRYQHATKLFFSDLVKLPDNNICFTEIIRDKNRMIFTGNAYSTIALTTFLTQWKSAYLFSEIRIKQIQKDDVTGLVKFRFDGIEIDSLHGIEQEE